MITKHNCPICKVKISSNTSKSIAGINFVTYQCGHSETLDERFVDFTKITSSDNKKLRPYQIIGSQFAVKANGRALIADEMGIGKTWQTASIIKVYSKELKSTVIFCKKSLCIQWFKEVIRLCGLEFMPQIIESENDFLLPVKVYIISYDILAGSSSSRTLKNGEKKVVKKGVQDLETLIIKLDPSLIIMDEIQHIKNRESKRTQAVIKACKHSKHIIALSGTPIKNNAGEYFPILHILYPNRFPSYMDYDRRYLQSYWNGYGMKTGGLNNMSVFKKDTEDFIIRRTRAEVLPDLPKISRQTNFVDLKDEVEELYIKTLQDFQNSLNSADYDKLNASEKSSCILAYLSKMRHITGLAKIEPCLDYIEDFITETDRKIIIFLHHKDVADVLITRLSESLKKDNHYGLSILKIDSSMTAVERTEAVSKFRSPNYRIIICSTLAAGEGIDGLQCASDCIFLERQWNPANEEQAEGRIVRLGQESDKLTANYFIAIGTVDEFFAEIVEKKRSIISNTLDFVETQWDQSSIMSELVETLRVIGGKKWGF